MSAPTSEPLHYESAIAELESIVTQLESGQLQLEQSLAAYNFRVDALNHSLMFTGNFDLSSIVIDGYTTGNVPP